MKIQSYERLFLKSFVSMEEEEGSCTNLASSPNQNWSTSNSKILAEVIRARIIDENKKAAHTLADQTSSSRVDAAEKGTCWMNMLSRQDTIFKSCNCWCQQFMRGELSQAQQARSSQATMASFVRHILLHPNQLCLENSRKRWACPKKSNANQQHCS